MCRLGVPTGWGVQTGGGVYVQTGTGGWVGVQTGCMCTQGVVCVCMQTGGGGGADQVCADRGWCVCRRWVYVQTEGGVYRL